jgi:hypothetical protein
MAEWTVPSANGVLHGIDEEALPDADNSDSEHGRFEDGRDRMDVDKLGLRGRMRLMRKRKGRSRSNGR